MPRIAVPHEITSDPFVHGEMTWAIDEVEL
jgi:hypothetical protein